MQTLPNSQLHISCYVCNLNKPQWTSTIWTSQLQFSVPELQYNLYNYEPISNKAKAEQNCIPESSGTDLG